MVSHECTERQKDSEKQAELCKVKAGSNELALPDKQAHASQKPSAAVAGLTEDLETWLIRFVH